MKSQVVRGNESIPIKIFETNKKGKNKVTVIESKIKAQVLAMLSDGGLDFDDIVKNTGKSKSTISIHLKHLREEGIVAFKLKEEDQRKKIFYIDAKQLCEVSYSNGHELENQKLELLVSNLVDGNANTQFTSLFFQAIRTFLVQSGVNIDYLLHEFGVKLGAAVYDKIKADNNEELSFNLSNFWKHKGLGSLKIDFGNVGDIINVTVSNSLTDPILPNSGDPACFLGSGILKGVFSTHTGQKVLVRETKCYNMGDPNCLFEIEPIQLSDSSIEIFN
ncbi:MAG: V4R domain-containing protein [Methanobacteriaceae archaeon]